MQDLLQKKAQGEELTNEELNFFINGCVNKNIHDCQIGAMLMAMKCKGLSVVEAANLTKAMVNSGSRLSWDDLAVDKHSTGGVGDKISIPLAPALAACGVKVPMMSGRGLDFTGGTLDKLESIPGYQVSLSMEKMKQAMDTVGCFIAATTEDICPGDRITYKFRDVTSTVDCNGLIVGSILSKKVAEGAKSLVLDLKVGKATFCKDLSTALNLKQNMLQVAQEMGINLNVILSEMDHPIGKMVGNALEIQESVEFLKGQPCKDLEELVLVLGGSLLHKSGIATSFNQGEKMIKQSLDDGSALKKFYEMLLIHGVQEKHAKELCYGDVSKVLPSAKNKTAVTANNSGWVADIDALKLARFCRDIGAGRKQPQDVLNLAVGVEIVKTVGDAVKQGETLMYIHHDDLLKKKELLALQESAKIVNEQVSRKPRVVNY